MEGPSEAEVGFADGFLQEGTVATGFRSASEGGRSRSRAE
jgi:hypothetical protein